MLLPLMLAGAAIAVATSKSQSGSRRITSGTATLIGGKSYRIDLDVGGRALNESTQPHLVAEAVRASLEANGGYDVYVSPTYPIHATYSIDVPMTTPVVLNVPAQQMIGGLPADYTFRAVQALDKRR